MHEIISYIVFVFIVGLALVEAYIDGRLDAEYEYMTREEGGGEEEREEG